MSQENTPISFLDLITKFYYKQNHLCFQIILITADKQNIPYKEYTDYNQYKSAFEKLSKMKLTIKATTDHVFQKPVQNAFA